MESDVFGIVIHWLCLHFVHATECTAKEQDRFLRSTLGERNLN